MSDELSSNPDSLPKAAAPQVGWYSVNGTNLYAEVRGAGPPVLLIGAADEDAEVYRPIAERLSRMTVVTYDRRGTLRSGREDWPDGGASRHADDASGLLGALDLRKATVFGASAGGIVALQLALRHPEQVERALIFEPGYFRHAPGGEKIQQRAYAAVDEHLAIHPNDWAGAASALGRAISDSVDPTSRGFFSPPSGKEWYAERGDINAESLIRGDLAMTLEEVNESDLASAQVEVRFAFGSTSLPIFREITTRLAAIRGDVPDRIEEVGHSAYYSPNAIVSYILGHAAG